MSDRPTEIIYQEKPPQVFTHADPAVGRPYLVFALCFFTVVLGALNSVLASGYLPDITETFTGSRGDAQTGTVGAWLGFAFLIGGSLGGISMGFMSDRIGRRAVLSLSLLSVGLGALMGGLAPSWPLLAATRVLVGAGVGAALVVSAVLLSEVWEKQTRAVALGILSVAYPVGIIGSGMVTALAPDWRTAFLYGAGCLLLMLPVWKYLPVKSTHKKATEDGAQQNLVLNHRKELFSGMLIYGAMLIGIWATFSWLPTWVQTLTGVDEKNGQSLRGMSVALLGVGGLVGGIASGFAANRWGRKKVQAVCFTVCLVMSFVLFQTISFYFWGVPLGISLLGFAFGVSQGVLNTYIPELFHQSIRSGATGLCFHAGRVFTAFAVFFLGSFVVWLGGYGNAIFVFSLVYILGLFALWNTNTIRKPA